MEQIGCVVGKLKLTYSTFISDSDAENYAHLTEITTVKIIKHESAEHEFVGHEFAGHEFAGHECAGHECLGHEFAGIVNFFFFFFFKQERH